MWWRFRRDELVASGEHNDHRKHDAAGRACYGAADSADDADADARAHGGSRDDTGADGGPGTATSRSHGDAVRDPAGRWRRW